VKIERKSDKSDASKVQNYITIGNIIFIGDKEGMKYFPKNV